MKEKGKKEKEKIRMGKGKLTAIKRCNEGEKRCEDIFYKRQEKFEESKKEIKPEGNSRYD